MALPEGAEMPRMEYARKNELGLSQDALIREFNEAGLEYHTGSYERWFRGAAVPDADTYEVICMVIDKKLREGRRKYRLLGKSYWVDPLTGEPSSMNMLSRAVA